MGQRHHFGFHPLGKRGANPRRFGRLICHQSCGTPSPVHRSDLSPATIIGQTATVASLSVNKQHGQARFSGFNNNADITLQIVSDEEGLTENDVVSIVDYDDERNVYEVRLAENIQGRIPLSLMTSPLKI